MLQSMHVACAHNIGQFAIQFSWQWYFLLHWSKVSCNNYVGTNKGQDSVNKLHAKSIMF